MFEISKVLCLGMGITSFEEFVKSSELFITYLCLVIITKDIRVLVLHIIIGNEFLCALL